MGSKDLIFASQRRKATMGLTNQDILGLVVYKESHHAEENCKPNLFKLFELDSNDCSIMWAFWVGLSQNVGLKGKTDFCGWKLPLLIYNFEI